MKRAADALEWFCVAGAVWFIVAFVFIACSSMMYPFNFEWMEGQSIDIIQRIMDGKPVYTKPSIDYVPYLYTPLYFYVSALVAEVTGIGFFPARLVSTLSALGVGILIYKWIRKSDGSSKSALIGAGLFFAAYPLSGRWFDNSRVDSLFLLLTLGSLYTYIFHHGTRSAMLAGLLASAAFFTKQSALGIIMPVLAAGVFMEKRRSFITLGVLTILVASGILAYDAASDGWFSFFVFTVPAGHGFDPRLIWGFWRGDMLRPLGILLVITLGTVCFFTLKEWKLGARYAALVMGALGVAYIARLHGFGWINVLMSAHLILALMTGLALAVAKKQSSPLPAAALALAVLWQMHTLYYNPKPFIPTQTSVDAGNRFLADLSHVEGDVLIPELQYVQTRAGKQSYDLGMAAFDLLRSDLKDRDDVKKEFMQELTQAIASGRFSAIMPGRLVPSPGLNKGYIFKERLQYPKEYVTGAINFLRTDLFMRMAHDKPLAEPKK